VDMANNCAQASMCWHSDLYWRTDRRAWFIFCTGLACVRHCIWQTITGIFDSQAPLFIDYTEAANRHTDIQTYKKLCCCRRFVGNK